MPDSPRPRHPLTETPLKMNNASMRMGSNIRRYAGEAPTTVRPGGLDQQQDSFEIGHRMSICRLSKKDNPENDHLQQNTCRGTLIKLFQQNQGNQVELWPVAK